MQYYERLDRNGDPDPAALPLGCLPSYGGEHLTLLLKVLDSAVTFFFIFLCKEKILYTQSFNLC